MFLLWLAVVMWVLAIGWLLLGLLGVLEDLRRESFSAPARSRRPQTR